MASSNRPRQLTNPLKQHEIRSFDEAAQEADLLTELTGRTLLHSGLRTDTYTHQRERWLTKEHSGGHAVIRVPDEEECIGGVRPVEQATLEGTNMYDHGVPCSKCRVKGECYWTPKTDSLVRLAPILEEAVYDLLEEWFRDHEQIPLSLELASKQVERVGDMAGLDRTVKPRDLRHTYGTRLVRMGFDVHAIAALMGHKSLEWPRDYIHFVNQ